MHDVNDEVHDHGGVNREASEQAKDSQRALLTKRHDPKPIAFLHVPKNAGYQFAFNFLTCQGSALICQRQIGRSFSAPTLLLWFGNTSRTTCQALWKLCVQELQT